MEIRDAGSGETTVRAWSGAELERSIAWLKRMNARGSDIHVRPAGEHGLVLVDGLKARGHRADEAPGVRAGGDGGGEPGELPGVGEAVGGGAVGAGAAGRGGGAGQALRGRGEERRRLAVRAAGGVHEPGAGARPGGAAAVRAGARLPRPGGHEGASAIWSASSRRWTSRRRGKSARGGWKASGRPSRGRECRTRCASTGGRLSGTLGQHGFKTDFGRMDEAIATELAKNSRFTLGEIERGIREGSPNVESRKAGHMEDVRQAHGGEGLGGAGGAAEASGAEGESANYSEGGMGLVLAGEALFR